MSASVRAGAIVNPSAPLTILLTSVGGDVEAVRRRILKIAPGIGEVAACPAPTLLREAGRGGDVDAVLVDCEDPAAELDAVAAAVRACPLVPVLVLAGVPESAASERVFRLGVQDYLIKRETRGEHLQRAIHHAIERKRLEIRLKTTLGELGEANARLRTLALKDPLTGALNRRAFYAVAGQALARAGRCGRTVALLFCDLDDFKLINDRHGHGVGDRVLEQFGQRASALLRRGDVLGRLGGDEFAVLLEDPGLPAGRGTEAALDVAARLVRCFEAPFDAGGVAVAISVSVGIAGFPEQGSSLDALVAAADRAMYRAKASGCAIAWARSEQDAEVG